MYYSVYEDRKSDVFLNNPVIRPAVEKEEMLERVYSDLDFEKNDNVILLTTKLSSGADSGSEIIYALRDTDNLAIQLTNAINKT